VIVLMAVATGRSSIRGALVRHLSTILRLADRRPAVARGQSWRRPLKGERRSSVSLPAAAADTGDAEDDGNSDRADQRRENGEHEDHTISTHDSPRRLRQAL
jgi:hypothetical protein